MPNFRVPKPRDPITGLVRGTQLRESATDLGWDFQWRAGDYRFHKDGRLLTVSYHQTMPTSGYLIEKEGCCPMRIKNHQIKSVLQGTRCSCPTLGAPSGLDVIPSRDCPLHREDAIFDRFALEDGLDPDGSRPLPTL